MGADPSPAIGRPLDRVPPLLKGAAALVDACLAKNAKLDAKSFEEIRKRNAALLPGPAAASWMAEESSCSALHRT
jgi:hypothetical protein